MGVTTQSPLDERHTADVCRGLLDGAGEAVGVGLSAAVTEGLLTALAERDEPPSVRVIAAEPVLKELTSGFTLAGTLADLVADDVLAVRTTDRRPDGPVLLAGERVVSLVSAGRRTAALATDDAAFVAAARDRYRRLWTEADPFTLRTPPLSRVRETLAAELGPRVTEDFETMRTALASGRGDHLDAVDVSLLAAARNEALLYDISTWGEDVGVASRATFSRAKARLEETGLVATQKVPIDVGRPRLRLLLGDERLSAASADELVGVADGLLAADG